MEFGNWSLGIYRKDKSMLIHATNRFAEYNQTPDKWCISQLDKN